MAKRLCPKCGAHIIEAVDVDGNELELAKYRGTRLYGVRAQSFGVRTERHHLNVATDFTRRAWVRHDCDFETLDAPVRVAEFPPSLGDPPMRGLIGSNETDHDDRGNPL